MVLLVLLVGGVFFDIGQALVERQKLITAADRAANAGATGLNEQKLIDSNGATVELDPVVAQQKCSDVLINESSATGQAKTILDTGTCTVLTAAPFDSKVIEVTVTGTKEYGVIASWLGIASKTFTVTSRARPSCSDSAEATTGNC